MSRIETYAESKFIINLCEDIPIDEFDDKYLLWRKVYNLISKKSNLLIDSKDELIKNISNPIIKRLIKISQEGGSNILELKEHFEALNSNEFDIVNTVNPSAIYCFDKTTVDTQHGLFIADSKNYIDKFSKISKEIVTISIDRNNPVYNNIWDKLFKDKPPLNTIIIADNYLLDKPDSFKNNLFAILDALLPVKNIKETIHIALVVKRDVINLQNKYFKISEYLQNKNSNFKLGIYQTPLNAPHDRMIITNYFYLSSGHSFDIVNGKGKINKDTILTYHPIGSNESQTPFNIETKKLSNYTKGCDVVGDRENRLLDHWR